MLRQHAAAAFVAQEWSRSQATDGAFKCELHDVPLDMPNLTQPHTSSHNPTQPETIWTCGEGGQGVG